ncbi:MAG: hypothetical protein K5787_03535 [Lentisphaeria bacterium]|nr:hypothetical protein [Lentisphaeria bacterium]
MHVIWGIAWCGGGVPPAASEVPPGVPPAASEVPPGVPPAASSARSATQL